MKKQRIASEHGKAQEKRILDCLYESPKTDVEVAQSLSMGTSNVTIYLRRMRAESPRRVYVHSYRRTTTGHPKFIWGAGNYEDAEFTPNRMPSPILSINERVEQALIHLASRPMTAHELADVMFLTVSRVRVFLRYLRNPKQFGGRRICIVEWKHPGKRGDLAPRYAPGNKKDKPKPKKSSKERYKRSLEIHGGRSRMNALRRANDLAKRLKNKPNTIFGALGL